MNQKSVQVDILIPDRADPYIIRNGEWYYFTASYPMYGASDKDGYDRVILRRAKSIQELANADEITIWDENTSETSHRFIWAPELHKIGGSWYVFYAGSGSADNIWDINCRCLRCMGDDPYQDAWEEIGKFIPTENDSVSFTNFSLDMTYFHCNDKHYVIWAQNVGNSKLFMATIDPKVPWKLTSMPMLLTEPENDWECVRHPVNEGASVIKHNGKIFVSFSASGTGPEYCVGLLYADENADLMNPSSWVKQSKPALTSEDLIDEYGPGHNSFTKDEAGNDIFVYHSRPKHCFEGNCGYSKEYCLYDPCRSARVRKVVWGENEMPILNRG